MTGHFLNSKGSFLLTDNFDFGCVGRLKTLSVLGSALVGPLHQILGDITDDQRAILKDFSVEVRVQGHTICGKGGTMYVHKLHRNSNKDVHMFVKTI